ncbi:Lrp/AsnC family transcriptional regulator [Parasphingopyxis marina]|uniref:Lrp/AsnC family transcriptional regulator n=1 Tax=Parasphingopyxis marina TaxID=2761622 RepID=A0A842HTA4_9SPHN|nr:Lrp/AsnC family transcriptional regulator [Parasphingopyxis marina]MBC2776316.1 Lrp/AsnC family transcriptional regulator [Parasphingopyxis marina]
MTDFDRIDRNILHALEKDGRISNVELAAKVALSPSACLRRVQALEQSGAIRGYRAIVSPEARGVNFIAYLTVGLSRHTKAEQEAFERAIANAPEVRECHNVTGTVEYLLRVETADLAAYKHFHTEVIGAIPQVATMISYIVMESPKDERC